LQAALWQVHDIYVWIWASPKGGPDKPVTFSGLYGLYMACSRSAARHSRDWTGRRLWKPIA